MNRELLTPWDLDSNEDNEMKWAIEESLEYMETEAKKTHVITPSQIKTESNSNTFECCVCYGDGQTLNNASPVPIAGKIITQCRHDICAECYTKIIMIHGSQSQCPMCRRYYVQENVHSLNETSEPRPHIVLNEVNQLALYDVLEMLNIRPPRVYSGRNFLFQF
jgi:hypothetical protein